MIIGCGAAGLAAAEEIVKRSKKASVTLLSGEAVQPYSRPLISHVLAGETAESQVFLGLNGLRENPRVAFRTSTQVEAIDTERQQVLSSDGDSIPYDRLLIAAGSLAASPPIPGLDLPGVKPFITLADLKALQRALPACRQVVVLGGGLIGLRAAYALLMRGIDVTVVELLPGVLGSVLDQRGSDLIVELLESKGIKILLNCKVTNVEGDPRRGAVGVMLDNGVRLPCQLLVQCAGVVPAVGFVRDSGIETGRGVTVDEFLQTDVPGVFAAGDCAEPLNPVTGRREIVATWTQARLQGRIAGRNLCGAGESCPVGFAENSIGFFGAPCVTFGVTEPPSGGSFEILTKERRSDGSYRKIVLKDGRIVGAVFFKDIEGSGWIDRLIREKIDVSSVKDGILTFRRDYMNLLKSLQAEKMLGDVEWPERIGMKIEYHKRFDEEKWRRKERG